MRNIKFSRRALLAGLSVGGAFCGGLGRNLYAQTAPRVTRVAMFGYANGSHPDSAPTGNGTDFVLKPHMAPLETLRNDILVFRNMTMQRGSGNSHKATSFSIFGLGATTSIDQTFANHFKGSTPLASLEISIGQTAGGGGVIPGLSQLNGSFLPGVRNPVAAYQRIAERIAGDAVSPDTGTPTMTSPAATEVALLRRKSVLDFIKDDVKLYQGRLGPEERTKMDFYLESLRTLERDVTGTITPDGMGGPVSMSTCTKLAAPTISKNTSMNDMSDHNRLYLDVIAMAFACNVTRVATGMWGGGESDEPFNYAAGAIKTADWHATSHLDPAGSGGQMMIRIQAFMAGEFAYLLEKLKGYSDGEHSVLDNTAAVLSTQNGTSTQVAFAATDHPKQNSPFIVAGSCGGAWKTGRVIDCNGRAHNDVYLSIAKAIGMNVNTVGLASWCQGPMIT